ncbi:MAG: VOC family protein [Pyrinomonadaceae bacterium]|nr:VOC family protein [Pyrinomonadaceae bacterium]
MKIKRITPMLLTKKLQETSDFYEKFLGFRCRGKYPQDAPCWMSLWNGENEIAFYLSNENPEFENPVFSGTIYFEVENVDELWEKLKDKVEIVYELKNFDYGMREFGIKDCNGYILNLGQNIE